MSLLTRLWLSVLGAMLLVLGVSFAVNVLTARNYLEQQLFAQASDSAASLALSMSQQSKDAAMSELLVSALFDSGHFESIVYRDVQGKALVERHTAAPAPTAPAWFVALVPLEARPGEALVSDGWRQAGKVEVRASARYAYGELWAGIFKLALTQGLITLLLCAVVAALMRWLQKPLKAIVEQAEAIGLRRFVTIDEPAVPELRVVGRAMNTMVRRVKDMFTEQAGRIEALRKEVMTDSTTGVPNRTLFMGSLRAALSEEQAQPSGLLLLVRIRDLAGLNARLDRQAVDALLRDYAETLQALVPAGESEAVVARLNGSEFGLICPGMDEAGARALGENLLIRLQGLSLAALGQQAASPACVGWLIYRRGEGMGELLARLDSQVMLAETARVPIAGCGSEAAVPGVSAGDWRQRLELALARRDFFLTGFPVVSADGSLLHQEMMLRMRDQAAGELTAGQFMPAAIRHHLTGALDLLSLELALDWLRGNEAEVAVNVSAQSLLSPDFVPGVRRLLQASPLLARRLWVEIPERGLVDAGGLNRLAGLAEVLRQFDSKLGIEHFGSKMEIDDERQQSLSLDYFKLDGSFVGEIDESVERQKFVRSLVDVARSLQIQVIAERVGRVEEIEVLRALGVAGMTGPAIRL